jgi:hypothetical protein
MLDPTIGTKLDMSPKSSFTNFVLVGRRRCTSEAAIAEGVESGIIASVKV